MVRFEYSKLVLLRPHSLIVAGPTRPARHHYRSGRTSKHARCLEGALQVTLCLLSENVDLDGLSVIEIFDAHESLNEQGLGKVEVDVHDAHHGDTHVC